MSISTRIQAIEQHLTDDYNVLEVAGADLTNVDKNILNLKTTWQERLLYFMNNGTDVVWNNWDKVTGEGTIITLNNTEEAPMTIALKGNTSQETTTGKNLFNIEGRYETGTGITYTKNDDGSYTLNGTANGNNFLRGLCYLNEQHTISYTSNTTNANVIIRTRTGTPSAQTGIQDQMTVSSTSGSLTSSKQFDFVEISIVNGTTLNNFKIYIQLEKGSSATSFEPYTNGASPNPDYPQDIHVVSGDNSIVVCGKNLLDITLTSQTKNGVNIKVNEDNSITLNGTATSGLTLNLNYTSGKYINLTSGETYTISIKNNNGVYLRLAKVSDNSNVATFDSPRKNITFTSNYTGDCFVYLAILNNTTFNNLTIYPMIEKSSSETTYEPYKGASYPISLGDIQLLHIPNTNYYDKIDKSSGKNLVETIDIYNGYPVKSIGSVISYNASANSITYMKCAYVNANKTYTLSWNYATPKATGNRDIIICDDNKIELESFAYSNINNKSYTFTPTHNGWIYASLDTNAVEVMLNEGTTALEYEPYGTGWYLNKQIGKVVLDGTQNITQAPDGIRRFNARYSTLGLNNIKDGNGTYDTAKYRLCDHFIHSNEDYHNQVWGVYYTYNGWLVLYDTNSVIADATALANWFSNNNTSIYYVLATPTYTEITDSTLLSQLNALAKSYASQTNISQESNDLASILNATALEEMS